MYFSQVFSVLDFVKAAMKIPNAYSCSPKMEKVYGTICIPVVLIMFYIFADFEFLASGYCQFCGLIKIRKPSE